MELGRSKRAVYLLAFFIPFVVYTLTAPADLTLGIFGSDSGELITASITNGIPHPSGYPTWLIASKAFAQLPIGRTLAHRYNLFSVLCMSLAMLTLARGCGGYLKKNDPFAPISAVLAIAFTITVWSQAVITEVYALNGLMVTIVIWLLSKIDSGISNNHVICGIGFATALALTTHLTSILLLPAVGLLLFAHLTYKTLFKTITLFSVGFIIGFTPFFLLFLRAESLSPVMWGDPSTISGWWWLVSGTIYRPNLFTLSIPEIVARIQSIYFANPIHLIPLLIPLGAIVGWRSPSCTKSHPLLPGALLLTAVLYTLYAISYNTTDWRVFLMPANLCLVIPLANGLANLKLGRWGFTLPLLLFALNLPILLNGRTDETRLEAETAFAQVPENAVLLTDGRDETLFPIWYVRYAENQRPDTIVVDQNLFAFDWYRKRLAAQHPELKAVDIDDLITFRQQNRPTRPICDISLHPFALNCTDG